MANSHRQFLLVLALVREFLSGRSLSDGDAMQMQVAFAPRHAKPDGNTTTLPDATPRGAHGVATKNGILTRSAEADIIPAGRAQFVPLSWALQLAVALAILNRHIADDREPQGGKLSRYSQKTFRRL
jgi:hypothetical protein